MSEEIELYAVRNDEGKWFRAKGRSGRGNTWVDELKNARIYNKLSPARATVTFFANHYKEYKTPELVKLVVSDVVVIDETERVEKAKEKKRVADENREVRVKKWELERAQNALEEAKKRLEALKR